MEYKSRILIVEDEIDMAESINTFLTKLGYDIVGIVDKGEDAIRYTDCNHPDLILMDIRLKGTMNGIEAAERILQSHDIPIIYISAHSDEKTLTAAQKSGPFSYILKPFEYRELELVVAAALCKAGRGDIWLSNMKEKCSFWLNNSRGILFRSDFYFAPMLIFGPIEDIVGYRAEDFLEKNISWASITYPEDGPIYSEEIMRKFKEIPNFQYEKELRIIRKDGDVRWIRTHSKNICDKDRKPNAIEGVVFDITPLKEAGDKINKISSNLELLKETTLYREIRMIDLKKEVNDLCREAGRPLRYNVSAFQ